MRNARSCLRMMVRAELYSLNQSATWRCCCLSKVTASIVCISGRFWWGAAWRSFEVGMAFSFKKGKRVRAKPSSTASAGETLSENTLLFYRRVARSARAQHQAVRAGENSVGQDEQKSSKINGRGDRIRTCDIYVPNVALYQSELHPGANSHAQLPGFAGGAASPKCHES